MCEDGSGGVRGRDGVIERNVGYAHVGYAPPDNGSRENVPPAGDNVPGESN